MATPLEMKLDGNYTRILPAVFVITYDLGMHSAEWKSSVFAFTGKWNAFHKERNKAKIEKVE